MQTSELFLSDDIPGVFQARQKRSVRIRDSYIHAGVVALNERRLEDLTISDLAAASGNSVGSFYTRFQDKEAYFRVLRAHTIESLEREAIEPFNAEFLRNLSGAQALEALVDLMVDLFTSRFRGVLRESLLLILEPDDPWAPMRASAVKIVSLLHKNVVTAFPNKDTATTRTQLSFCFQLIVGTLQNDLVNDYHVFSTKNDSLRMGLKDAVCAYMGVKQPTLISL